MIFGDDLLFIHVPKTGGSSITVYLLDVLPKPIHLSQPHHDDNITDPGVIQIPGVRHETLAEARDVVAGCGFAIDCFPLILATIRDPYDLELSRYAYLRQGFTWERGPEQALALTSTFEEYAVRNRQRGGLWPTGDPSGGETPGFAAWHRRRRRRRYPNAFEDYFLLDGHIPDNLRILRFEHLADDLAAALAPIGLPDDRPLPWINQSPRGDVGSAYTPRAEEAVYRRYRWAFDQGFYPRLDLAAPTAAESPPVGAEPGLAPPP